MWVGDGVWWVRVNSWEMSLRISSYHWSRWPRSCRGTRCQEAEFELMMIGRMSEIHSGLSLSCPQSECTMPSIWETPPLVSTPATHGYRDSGPVPNSARVWNWNDIAAMQWSGEWQLTGKFSTEHSEGLRTSEGLQQNSPWVPGKQSAWLVRCHSG